MKEQLELKEIVGYLPYGLKMNLTRIFFERKNVLLIGSTFGFNETTKEYWILKGNITYGIEHIKPILFPISLFKDINSNEMNELNVDLFNQMELCDLANKKIHFQNCNHSTILICLENKIDFQNLIEKDLAIAVTEEFNPYK
jgi:glycyl-tRNA synthetase alpha subunit